MVRLTLTAAALIAALATTPAAAESPAEAIGPEVGKLHPRFSLRTLNPERSKMKIVSTKRLVGPKAKKPVETLLLTFGASYCAPCKEEMAALKPLSPRFEAAGAKIAAVVIDSEPEGVKVMQALAESLEVSYPVVADAFGTLARRYNVSTLPLLVNIDRDGVVQKTHVGYELAVIEKLLAELEAKAGIKPGAPADKAS